MVEGNVMMVKLQLGPIKKRLVYHSRPRLNSRIRFFFCFFLLDSIQITTAGQGQTKEKFKKTARPYGIFQLDRMIK